MKGKRISDDPLSVIYKIKDEMDENGKHPSEREIARRLHMSHATISNVIRRRIPNTFDQIKVKLGAKPKTTVRQDRNIISSVLRKRFSNLISITKIVSRYTVRRRLIMKGIKYRLAIQNVLTNRQRKVRVKFARDNKDRDWDKVIFSDECCITLKKASTIGRVGVYRRTGERLSMDRFGQF